MGRDRIGRVAANKSQIAGKTFFLICVLQRKSAARVFFFHADY
jgi:hypothetical protein